MCSNSQVSSGRDSDDVLFSFEVHQGEILSHTEQVRALQKKFYTELSAAQSVPSADPAGSSVDSLQVTPFQCLCPDSLARALRRHTWSFSPQGCPGAPCSHLDLGRMLAGGFVVADYYDSTVDCDSASVLVGLRSPKSLAGLSGLPQDQLRPYVEAFLAQDPQYAFCRIDPLLRHF